MNSLLHGITALDFSEYIAGPYCGLLLADLGARVIKVEPPGRRGGAPPGRGNTRMCTGMLNALGIVSALYHRDLGKYKASGHPIRFLKTAAVPGKGAPALGEDTAAVLRQFGYGDEEIARLKAAGIVK